MTDAPIRVCVTGAAGQIAYALIPRIASGELFGPKQPVELRLLDIEPAMSALDAVLMEIHDCSFPLLAGCEATTDLKTAFDGVSWALLVGSFPRREGMERRDLLATNGKIFGPQGRAISEYAAPDVRVLVVGNPCNTNCLIARESGRDVPADRWFAMVRLDANRTKAFLAEKAGADVTDVRNVAIWGNHSPTMFPDYQNAKIGRKSAVSAIGDKRWFTDELVPTVQQRGAAVIKARGASSAASAAQAAIDSVRSVVQPTKRGDCASLAVVSRGEYGVPEGLQFGFPVASDGDSWKVIEGSKHDDFAREKIRITTEELLAEREAVKDLL